MPDHHDRFLVAILGQQVAELRKSGARTQRGIEINLALEGKFVGDQRGRLGGALQRAGDDDIDVRFQDGERTADVAALLDTFAVKGTLVILDGIVLAVTGGGVAKKIDEHDQIRMKKSE